jgi:hypothetical protein
MVKEFKVDFEDAVYTVINDLIKEKIEKRVNKAVDEFLDKHLSELLTEDMVSDTAKSILSYSDSLNDIVLDKMICLLKDAKVEVKF